MMTKEGADAILKQSGYQFPPLWTKIPPLQPSSIDFSIIIPVYNDEKFLQRLLDAILNQKTKFTYEVICINDGSTDNSQDILDKYKEKYPSLLTVILQPNKGISSTRNRGITIAKGEYIGFIDDDDTVEPNYVEIIIEKARNFNADIVQTSYSIDDPTGHTISIKSKPDIDFTPQSEETAYSDVAGFIWGGALKKQLFEHMRFPEGFWYEDMITRLVMMRLAKKISLSSKVEYHKCQHQSNASKVLWKKGNIKATDQYWLSYSLVKYSLEELKLPKSGILYSQLLKEYSSLLYSRTEELPRKTRKAIFALAAQFLSSLYSTEYQLSEQQEKYNHAILRRNFSQWEILSQKEWLKSKIGK